MNEKIGNAMERLNEMLLEFGTMEKDLLDTGLVDVDMALALLEAQHAVNYLRKCLKRSQVTVQVSFTQ